MPKGKDSSLGKAIMKNKAAAIRTKKQELREKKKVEKAQAGLIPETGLKSILDINNIDDFLDTVNLAQRNFETEKGSAIIVDRELKEVKQEYDPELSSKYRTMQIPRRPLWDNKRSPEEQDMLERQSFLEWRRNVAIEVEHATGALAPFEKNLEVWRQLWRVVEKSDCLVQIVDSRNPLLFRCPDVDKYVKEVNPCKRSVLIVNKADLIPEHVRIQWGRYFDSINVSFVFFSARAASAIIERQQEEEAKQSQPAQSEEKTEDVDENVDLASDSDSAPKRPKHQNNKFADLMDDDDEDSDDVEDESESESDSSSVSSNSPAPISELPSTPSESMQIPSPVASTSEIEEQLLLDMACTTEERQRYRIHTREEVLQYLEQQTKQAYFDLKSRDMEQKSRDMEQKSRDSNIPAEASDELEGDLEPSIPAEMADRRPMVGMLGFPNVGKSSLINVLLGVSATSHGAVRVAVGATPGKTKHLQTAVLSADLMLCDCPGLVFPVFMNTKADLLFNGVLPASNMRDYLEPVALVCQRVPREELERVYHIKLPRNPLDPPNAVPHPRQLLHELCTVRGYMASNHSGVNEPRGAIVVMKDVLNGVLQWWIPPPSLGVVPANPISTIPEKAVAMDPDEMSREMAAETAVKPAENGGRHKPRVRNVKERSAKKSHKGKKNEQVGGGDIPYYQSKGAFQYI